MKVSIIVPAFNEEKLIERSLKSIRLAAAAFDPWEWEYEIIVCDNNSSDRTAQIATKQGARVCFEAINQIARARNKGASVAIGDWLVFVDADSFPPGELFAEMAARISGGHCLGGGAIIELDQPVPLAPIVVGAWNRLSRLKRWMAGSFIFCEAQAFHELGGFNLEFFVGEEIEFSERLGKLARLQKKQVCILHGTPLKTSARKFHLYRFREYIFFLLRSALRPGKAFKNRENCAPWYDGRR